MAPGPSNLTRGYAIALISAAILSTTAILIRHLTQTYHIPPLVLAFWRDGFVVVTLLCVLGVLRPFLLRLDGEHLLYLIVYGLVLAVFNALWTLSVSLNGAAISTVDRWPDESERARWRSTGKLEVLNARTGQVLPLYTDTLDDVERHAAAALDIQAAAGRVAVPWLILHGTVDPTVAIAEAERLARAAPAGTAPLIPVPGAGHTFGATHPWRGSTAELDLVMKETVAWLGRHLF